MITLFSTVIYIVFLALISFLWGSLSRNKMTEKQKRLPQFVALQFWTLVLIVTYAVILYNGLAFAVEDPGLRLLAIVVVVSYLTLIVHRLFKGLGSKHGLEASSFAEPLVKVFTWIGAPFTFFVRIPVLNEDRTVTEEEIRELINTSQISGHIEEPQKELFENVFEFDDTSLEEICTHRSEVVCLYTDDPPEKWNTTILNNRHTLYPVCGEDQDDVVGVLDTRDYFRLEKRDLNSILSGAVDKPLFVLENTKADECFMEMKKRKTYFAIVMDEYGGMSGIVTLHDIVETILGEMHEEDDEVEPAAIQKLDTQTYRIYGYADLEDVQEVLDLKLPVDDYDTFGGFILALYGSIPDDGERFSVHTGSMDIAVREMKNHRVMETIVQLKNKEGEKDETTAGSD